MKKLLIALLFIAGCSTAPTYTEMTFVKPESTEWLEAVDEVVGCYERKTFEDVGPLVNVTIERRSQSALFLFPGTQGAHIMASNLDEMKFNLMRAIVATQHPELFFSPQEQLLFMSKKEICYGRCFKTTKTEDFLGDCGD